MSGDAAEQGIGMQTITHRFRIGSGVSLQAFSDPGLLDLRDQTLHAEIAHCLVATAAAEDEIDGRQHVALSHLRHHETDRRGLRLRRTGRTPLALVALGCTPDLAVGMQSRALIVEERVQAFGTAEAELQRHRSEVAEHQTGGAMDPFNPIGELPCIGHRGRQRDELNRGRAVNDRFFPDGASLGIVHVVALVQHHGFHIRQWIVMLIRLGVKHVPEDFRGHHHDRGFAIDAEIACHQADVLGAELLAEITKLLIGQRLQRRGVEHLLTVGHRPVDGVLTDQRLP